MNNNYNRIINSSIRKYRIIENSNRVSNRLSNRILEINNKNSQNNK